MTPEEMAAARKAARDALNAEAEGKEAPAAKGGGGMLRSLLGMGAGDLIGAASGATKALFHGDTEDKAKAIHQDMEAGGDFGRVTGDSAAAGMANKARAAVAGTDLDTQLAQSNMAEQRLGPTATNVAKGIGTVSQGLALPGAAAATYPAAAVTGAGLAGVNAAGEAIGKGETPDPLNVGIETGLGAVGGLFGKYFGDRLGALIERKVPVAKVGGVEDSLWKTAKGKVTELENTVKTASDQFDKAGVMVDNKYIKGEVNKLAKEFANNKTFKVGDAPTAQTALDLLNKYADDGTATSLRDLNTLRARIRDLPFTGKGTLQDGVAFDDANLVRIIGKRMSAMFESLGEKNPAVVSGNIKEGLKAFKTMNETFAQKEKSNLVASAFDLADIATGKGTPVDKAFQAEFTKLYKNKLAQRTFEPRELVVIRQIAKGGDMTQLMNKLERSMGTGGIFSYMVNSLKAPLRGGAERGAEDTARTLFNNVAKTQLKREGTAGAKVGITIGSKGASSLGELIKPIEPSEQPQ